MDLRLDGAGKKTLRVLRFVVGNLMARGGEARVRKLDKASLSKRIDETDQKAFFALLEKVGFVCDDDDKRLVISEEKAGLVSMQEASDVVRVLPTSTLSLATTNDEGKDAPSLSTTAAPALERTVSSANTELRQDLGALIMSSALNIDASLCELYGFAVPLFLFARGGSFFPLSRQLLSHQPFETWVLSQVTDEGAQAALEDAGVLNQAPSGSSLAVLRTASDDNSLCHAALLASYGVHDRSQALRSSLGVAMGFHKLKPLLTKRLLEEHSRQHPQHPPTHLQILSRYNELVNQCSQQGAQLSDLHVFALSHVLRRPIIVYGSSSVAGIYLPTFATHTCNNARCVANFSTLPLLLAHHQDRFLGLAVREGTHPWPPLVPLFMNKGQRGARDSLPVRFLGVDEVDMEETLLERYFQVQTTADTLKYARVDPTKKFGETNDMWRAYFNHCRTAFDQNPSPPKEPDLKITLDVASPRHFTIPPSQQQQQEEEEEDVDDEALRLAIQMSMMSHQEDEESD